MRFQFSRINVDGALKQLKTPINFYPKTTIMILREPNVVTCSHPKKPLAIKISLSTLYNDKFGFYNIFLVF